MTDEIATPDETEEIPSTPEAAGERDPPASDILPEAAESGE